MPIRLLHQILNDLVESGLFIETRTKDDSTFGYHPACDINKLTIKSILEAIEHHGTDDYPRCPNRRVNGIVRLIETIQSRDGKFSGEQIVEGYLVLPNPCIC